MKLTKQERKAFESARRRLLVKAYEKFDKVTSPRAIRRAFKNLVEALERYP